MKLQKVFGKIWIGPGDDVYSLCAKFMNPDAVEFDADMFYKGPAGYAILNVADDYPEREHPRDMLYIHAGLCDGPEDWDAPYGENNSMYGYLHAVRSLEFLETGPWEVLVHCHGGVSRSCFVAAVYMAYVLRIRYPEAKAMLHHLYNREHIHPKHDPFAEEILELLVRTS